MTRMQGLTAGLALAGVLLAGVAGAAVIRGSDGKSDLVPDGKGQAMRQACAPRVVDLKVAAATGNGIAYHGGPIITGTAHVYGIWYGNWAGNSAKTILPAFVNGLSGSPYYNIDTTYGCTNSIAWSGATTDNYSHGTTLTDAAVKAVVSAAITSGRLPNDTNGIYFVFTTADVNESSGFCTAYCGWHNHAAIGGSDIKYSFVGDPARCPSACEAIPGNQPNGNPDADAIVYIAAAEINKTVTDPDLNGWYDSAGAENTDKCMWSLGTLYVTGNGSKANVHLGSHDYLVPENWVNAGGGYCSLHYP